MSILLESLNQEQHQAVTHKDGPLLIIAGAGTGKTTVITRRIAYLIEQNEAKPDQILALTFTDKAAGEMEERVDQLLPLGSYDLWISTFHSFCERILKQHGLHIGLPNDFKLLDKTGQWIFLFQNFDKFKLDYYRPLGSPNKFIDAMLDHFSKCQDELITPDDYLDYAKSLQLETGAVELIHDDDNETTTEVARINEIANAYHTYRQLLLDHNYLDFGGLIFYTIELLRRRPNIRKYYRNQFKFIMVDEFQDTNIAQYELIKLLCNDNNNLVVVGDDDQSIYKFRGASVSNILKLKEDFPNLKELTLINNYRNSQAILDLAYNFIQANNPNRLESKLGIKKQLKAHNKTKSTIEVIEGKDLSEEMNLVVQKILTLKANHPKSTWNDFAILIRANSTANELIPILEATQIPYSFVANRGLYKKPLIADLINYLKLLDNYHESSALFRIFHFPKFRLSALDLAHLTQFTRRKALSLYQVLQTPEALKEVSEDSKQKITKLLELLEKHTKFATEKSAVELFVQLVQDLNIAQLLIADTLENAQNRELLEQFYKKIESYTQENDNRTMRGFIEHLKLEQEAGEEGAINFDPNSGPESLKLLTVHSAKGLEFEFVFIVGMVDLRFPSRSYKEPIELPEPLIKEILPEGDFHLQEERRLFYVALTRAKSQLYLSWAKDYGGARTKKPSLFLTETGLVPGELAHKATGKVVFTKPKPSARQEIYKQLPVKFSFSQLAAYEKCPLEYKYAHYLRLPQPGSHYLSFGSTIHAVLQRYLEKYQQDLISPQQDLFETNSQVQLPPEKLLTELYKTEWLDDWYKSQEQKEQYRIRGKEILKTFYTASKQQLPRPKFIEQSFTIKLGDNNQYSFNGKIDRADETKQGLMIIDYKTSEKAPSKTTGTDIDQLRIYQLACVESLHLPVTGLQYWYLVPNEIVAVPLATPAELQELKAKLTETIEDIREVVKYDLFEQMHKKAKRHDCGFANLV
ncbi:MAG TPA: UvrD-helicase domain-containing protein [Candidatus Doudnabacteria bacterium]|nr:UvrD-helicase domain-containing protein [Candidatus Doudnabacteria bacterium]